MHTNRHQEAKLLLPDTFLSRKNAFAASSAPPDPLAGNGGGAPGKREGKGGEWWGWEEWERVSPRKEILAMALLLHRNC